MEHFIRLLIERKGKVLEGDVQATYQMAGRIVTRKRMEEELLAGYKRFTHMIEEVY